MEKNINAGNAGRFGEKNKNELINNYYFSTFFNKFLSQSLWEKNLKEFKEIVILL